MFKYRLRFKVLLGVGIAVLLLVATQYFIASYLVQEGLRGFGASVKSDIVPLLGVMQRYIVWSTLWAGLVLCVLAVWFVEYHIERPLSRLKQGLNKAVVGGGVVAYLPVPGETDELGSFATSINAQLVQVSQLQQNLTHARLVAEQEARLKSHILTTMSHEIRTLLNGLLSALQLLRDTRLSVVQRELTAVANSSGQHLLHILNDTLDVAKISAGKLVLNPSTLHLPTIVPDIVRPFESMARKKNLTLTVILESKIPEYVRCDLCRLRQITHNLLNNAIKFTHQGSITLTISALSATDEQTTLRFQIQDTGPGIPLAAQTRIFQPFIQADQGITPNYGGTGLGLTICKQLLEYMGGKIGCTSTPGKGTEFWFVLPVETVAKQRQKVTLSHGKLGKRVLLVKDDKIKQHVIVKMLQQGNEQVDVASSGKAALGHLDQTYYDLILMDCQLPDIDGYALTRSIRAWEAEHRVPRHPIIALSSETLRADREHCLAADMDDYCPVPENEAQLQALLARWLPPVTHGGH